MFILPVLLLNENLSCWFWVLCLGRENVSNIRDRNVCFVVFLL